MNKSVHQLNIEAFMLRAKQEVPVKITKPSEAVRLLRAKLILEEALETINLGLGVNIYNPDNFILKLSSSFEFRIINPFNMVELIDGCCDLKVVTTGTLSACGIPDMPFQEEIDKNNLEKFNTGYKIRDDGKIIKSPLHKAPDIKFILEMLK